MLTLQDTLVFAVFLTLFLGVNYLVFAYGGHWFFYRFLGPKIPHRRILEAEASPSQVAKEKSRSLMTQVIFFLTALTLYILFKLGWTQVYVTWDERGPLYFILSFFIVHQIHDAYFYWSHRLMHEWRPLKRFHFVHHESAPPTPFSALSFHPVEAFIQGFFWILISFLIPVSALWLFAFYSFMFYINMWGHSSYEFWHRDLLTHPILKALNTPTHHNVHHKYHKYNYSIYYNFWDRLCGTNHPEYENHYRAVKARTETAKTSRLMKLLKL